MSVDEAFKCVSFNGSFIARLVVRVELGEFGVFI